MKKTLSLLMMTLLAVTAWAESWVKTAPTALQTGDVVVIAETTGSHAMPNDGGASAAPSAVAITIASDEITSEVSENLQWTVTVDNGSYMFAAGESFLYCTNNNNGVRVGSGANNTFTISTEGYLFNTGQSRYIGVYNNQDWRCYTTINANIQDQAFAFFKKEESPNPVAPPVITLDPADGPYPEGTTVTANITCETDGAFIYYRIDDGDWILGKNDIPLTRSCTISARAVTNLGDNITSKTVAFHPVVNSIVEFNQASHETELFFNAPVTVIKQYNDYLYVQDETKGMLIYGNPNQTYQPGDVIPAGFHGLRFDYHGAPEMKNPTKFQAAASTNTLTPVEIVPNDANLDNVYRYVTIKEATITGNYIGTIDGGQVEVWNQFDIDVPDDNKSYDIVGIVSYYDRPQIIPLTITETPVVQQTYTVTIAPTEHGNVFMDNIYNESTPGTIVELYPTPDYGYELDPESFYYTYDPNPSGAFFTIVDNKFEMPESNVIVYATFKPSTFNVAIADGITNGTVTIVDDKTTATMGETVKVMAVPAATYEVKSITGTYAVSGGTGTIDLVAVPDEPNTYSFVMPAADVTVNVTFGLHAYNITLASDIEHGTVTFSPETATVGETVTVTATADEHYELTSFYYTYEEVTAPIRVDILNGQFVMPASDVVITAVFSPIYYTIGTSVIPQNTGTITVQDRATFNEEVTVTATANEGYQLKRLYYYFNAGGGIDAEYTIDNGTFAMPAINIIVAAEFEPAEPATYSINIAAAEHGTVEANPTGAHQGDEVVLTVAPDEGYELESLTVTTVETEDVEPQPGKAAENVELTKVDDFTYTFVMPGKSVNVTATFKESPLTGINGIRVDLHEGMRFVNPLGQVSNRPFRGVNIVIDGDKTYKVVF